MALHCSTATSALRCLKPSSVQQLASATRRASACSSQRGRRYGAATASSDNGSYTGTGVSPPAKGHHFLHIDDFSRDQLGQPPLLQIGAPAACIQCLWGPQLVGGQPGQPRHSQLCPRLGRRCSGGTAACCQFLCGALLRAPNTPLFCCPWHPRNLSRPRARLRARQPALSGQPCPASPAAAHSARCLCPLPAAAAAAACSCDA